MSNVGRIGRRPGKVINIRSGAYSPRGRDSEPAARSLQPGGMHEFLTQDPETIVLLQKIQTRIAPKNVPVLITGETGTGKELVACMVHNSSAHRQGPFVAVNAAATPENILESVFFGHEAGAFTGAAGRHIGHFESADGGTIFLDEIGDLPLDLQAKLLRVLQEGTLTRVGGHEVIKSDFRVVCATHRDLRQMVRDGKFREDLYYRLAVIPVNLKPLRDRPGDVKLLAEAFAVEFGTKHHFAASTISEAALERLRGARWPGNIRELRNTIERAVILAEKPEIRIGDIQINSAQQEGTTKIPLLLIFMAMARARLSIRDLTALFCAACLGEAKGIVNQAAVRFGVGRATLYRHIDNGERALRHTDAILEMSGESVRIISHDAAGEPAAP